MPPKTSTTLNTFPSSLAHQATLRRVSENMRLDVVRRARREVDKLERYLHHLSAQRKEKSTTRIGARETRLYIDLAPLVRPPPPPTHTHTHTHAHTQSQPPTKPPPLSSLSLHAILSCPSHNNPSKNTRHDIKTRH